MGIQHETVIVGTRQSLQMTDHVSGSAELASLLPIGGTRSSMDYLVEQRRYLGPVSYDHDSDRDELETIMALIWRTKVARRI